MSDLSNSPLYSPDLAPIPPEKRTWSKWNLAALWVGMAVCIPTYLLASYMMRAGLSWEAALTIIGLANLVINHSDGPEWSRRSEIRSRSLLSGELHLVRRASTFPAWFGPLWRAAGSA